MADFLLDKLRFKHKLIFMLQLEVSGASGVDRGGTHDLALRIILCVIRPKAPEKVQLAPGLQTCQCHSYPDTDVMAKWR